MKFKLVAMSIVAFGVATASLFSTSLIASDETPAFKIYGKVKTVGDLTKEDQATFYDIEKKKHELIMGKAESAYFTEFWARMGKTKGQSSSVARKTYLKENVKSSDKEVSQTLDKFKDHPQLSKLTKKEQEKQVEEYLKDRDTKDLLQSIIASAKRKGELVVVYPEPKEPIYNVTVTKDDHVRYGPEDTDTKGLGCIGDACAITIVEYSEFQCPFCSRVLPDVKRVLTEYKGKIRWIVRDFPLSFHDRARPAAIAAKCAAFQGKYWQMYTILFKNQRALSDADLDKYAVEIGLDKSKYQKCVKGPAQAEALINTNFRTGSSLGVTGTPAFFINGRRLSGALPFSEFKRVIDSELKSKKKS